MIFKPNHVEGNYIEGYEEKLFGSKGDELELITTLNSPVSNLYSHGGKWFFMVWKYAPGPGPGDFDTEYDTVDDCLADIINYYFGDPGRMWKCGRE